jgi:hypothetical protein
MRINALDSAKCESTIGAVSIPSFPKRVVCGSPSCDPDEENRKAAQQLFDQGRQTFRFDTFGDEAFSGDALRLHRAIEGEALVVSAERCAVNGAAVSASRRSRRRSGRGGSSGSRSARSASSLRQSWAFSPFRDRRRRIGLKGVVATSTRITSNATKRRSGKISAGLPQLNPDYWRREAKIRSFARATNAPPPLDPWTRREQQRASLQARYARGAGR